MSAVPPLLSLPPSYDEAIKSYPLHRNPPAPAYEFTELPRYGEFTELPCYGEFANNGFTGDNQSGNADPPPYPTVNNCMLPIQVSEPSPVGTLVYQASFSGKAVRLTFIRKVYAVLTLQLLVTFLVICCFILIEPVKKWVQLTLWFYISSYVVFIITYFTLLSYSDMRRSSPGNYIALTIFTLISSYLAATLSSYHSVELILIAIGITCALCFSVFLSTMQSRFEPTLRTGMLLAAATVFLLSGVSFGLSAAIVGTDTHNMLQCCYGMMGALVLSTYLVGDTFFIMHGRRRGHMLEPDETITTAVEVYMDISIILTCKNRH